MPVDEQIWPDWTPHKRWAQMYALRCLSHRVRKFGFEEVINRLDTKSLVAFSLMAHEPLASACRREALRLDSLALENIDV
jgi:hypothetical protein